MLQKRPYYAFLILRASCFSSTNITKNRSYFDHLPERSQKTNILMTLDKCDEPLDQNWFKPFKKSEAVGELYVLWCESELNHCPSKFHFWIQKLLFHVVLQRLRKPKHEAHDDGSQFERFTCSSSGKKKLSLNLATLKNASLTSRGQSLVIGPRSFTANHSSFVSTCQCWFPWQGPIRSQKNWSG